MNLSNLTSAQLKKAANLKDKIEAMQKQLDALLGGGSEPAKKKRKGGMSAAGRKAVAAAQRKRWAAVKAAKAKK